MAEAKSMNQQIPLRLFALAGLFAAGLSWLTAEVKKESIELDLTQAVRKTLSAANLPVVNVSFSGRVATLNGAVTTEDEVSLVEHTVKQVFGVRKVESRLSASQTETIYHTASVEPEFIDGLYVPSKQHPLEKLSLAEVQFVYAKADLMEASYPALDRLAMILKQYPQIQIELSVHTDNLGTPLGQITATEARAETVRQYLLEKGAKPEQVLASGYGATRPVASNEDEAGRIKNRRVEITVLKDR